MGGGGSCRLQNKGTATIYAPPGSISATSARLDLPLDASAILPPVIAARVSKTRLLLAAAVSALLLSLVLVMRFASYRSSAALALSIVPPSFCKTSPGLDDWRLRAVAAPSSRLVRGCFNGEFDRDLAMAHGWTPLLLATMTQDWRHAHDLIQSANVDAADDGGITPLMAAAKFGNAETIRELLAKPANPNATDMAGRTALHHAVLAAQPLAIELLLRATATAESRSPDGSDLCDLALATHNWEVIGPVLEHFPPASAWTPTAAAMLRAAANSDDQVHGRLLLSKHLQQPTLEGHAVPLLASAVVMGDTRLVKALLKLGVNPNVVVPAPCEKDFLRAIKSSYLRDYVEADSGTTPLMLAAGLGDVELVQALLAAGADRNRMTAHYKMLPLYFSTRTPSWRTTQLLLGSGPSPDALRIEISLGAQKMSVLKRGAPALTTACSTGRAGFSTASGVYVITDKDRDHRSTIYKVPMPYFMRLNCRDFGLHEGNVLSRNASHGCIRLPGETARRLFSEIPIGTLVNIN